MSDCVDSAADDDVVRTPSGSNELLWVADYEEHRKAILAKLESTQETLDPADAFKSIPVQLQDRLVKPLLRFLLMKQGNAPSLPIVREDLVRIFERARKDGNLVPAQKLFPYFLIETQKRLVQIFGIELKRVVKAIPSVDAKKKRDEKPTEMYYLQSLLPKHIRQNFVDKEEKELLGVIALLVRITTASEGRLKKPDAISLLSEIGFHEGVWHEKFGQWEKTIFDEALKRRYLIVSRSEPDVYEVGEAAFLQVEEDAFPFKFYQSIH